MARGMELTRHSSAVCTLAVGLTLGFVAARGGPRGGPLARAAAEGVTKPRAGPSPGRGGECQTVGAART